MIMRIRRRQKITITQKGDKQPLIRVAVLAVNQTKLGDTEYVVQIDAPDYFHCEKAGKGRRR